MLQTLNTIINSFLFKVFLWACLAVVIVIIIKKLYQRAKLFVLSRLVYSRSFSHDGQYCGEYVTLTETVYNPTIFPMFLIDVEYYLYSALKLENEYKNEVNDDSMIYCISRFNLMPFMRVQREHKILCSKRGEYNLESCVVYVKKVPVYISSYAKLLIYPKYVEYADVPFSTIMLQGAEESKKRLLVDPFMKTGVREYHFGDSLSMINFKATSRRPVYNLSDIMVNNLNYSSSRKILVCINFQVAFGKTIPNDVYLRMMEYALSYASSILSEAMKNGYLFSFAGNFVLQSGKTFDMLPFESGSMHLDNILNVMAKINLRSETSIYLLLEKLIGEYICETEIVFITPHMEDEIYKKLEFIEQNRNIISILSLDEEVAKYD